MQRRLGRGAGEVAGDPEDDAGEDDADEDGEAREEPGVARDVGQPGARRGGCEGGREVDERGDRGEHGAEERGDVEPAVDGSQPALAATDLGDDDADEGDERAHRGDDEREDEPCLAHGRLAEDEGCDEHDGIGLEEVCGHPGAVADVVAHVVGDGRGVARVVFGDALLDLADEVRSDVGRLGEDAAADAHEHREQRCAEAESFEDGGGVAAVDEDDPGCAEEAEPDDRHADDAAGADRDPGALGACPWAHGGCGDAHVRADRERHAEVPDRGREPGADEERDGPPDADPGVSRQEEEQPEHDHREQREGAELTAEVGGRTFLDGARDVLHLRGAVVCGEDLPSQDERDDETRETDDGDHADDRDAGRTQFEHSSSLTTADP